MSDANDTTAAGELKGCPFCGDAPRVTKRYSDGLWLILCRKDECPARVVEGYPLPTEAEAIAAWNTRAPATAPEGGVAVRSSLAEMVEAMERYEISVEDEPPGKHRAMMNRARTALASPPAAGPDDEWDEAKDVTCAECGAPHQMVRPGKTQPTCLCDAYRHECDQHEETRRQLAEALKRADAKGAEEVGWIPCAERMPDLVDVIPAGGISSGRKRSAPVLVMWPPDKPGLLPLVESAWCGMKDGDDWGRAPEGAYFWCSNEDLIAIHGYKDSRNDPPTHWMPLAAIAAGAGGRG